MGEHEGQRQRCANCGADFDAVETSTAATARACTVRCFGELARARAALLWLVQFAACKRAFERRFGPLEALVTVPSSSAPTRGGGTTVVTRTRWPL